MDPSSLITWALCAGVAWMIFAGFTGADEWLKAIFGKRTIGSLEKRVAKLEERLEALENK